MALDKIAFLMDLAERVVLPVPFAEQSDAKKVFSAVWTLESEVNIGGLVHYFDYDRGEMVGFVLKALVRIGAMQCAAIVERAIRAIFGNAIPTNQQKLLALVDPVDDAVCDELYRLDEEFYECPDDLMDLLYRFVQKHPKEFGLADAN